MSGRAIKFGNALKEIRLHLCQKSDASKGVRYAVRFTINNQYLLKCVLTFLWQISQVNINPKVKWGLS